VKIYKFKPKNFPCLTYKKALEILDNFKKGINFFYFSFDLGLTTLPVKIEKNIIKINESFSFELELLYPILEEKNDDLVYILQDGKILPLKFFSQNNFYKLKNIPSSAPTLEINGIHMHRIKDILPFQDAYLKVKSLNLQKNDNVLDICTGLGYTAIHSYRKGVSKVITIEKDLNVLKIAEFNPWSKDLEKIPIILGDAEYVIDEIQENFFNKIIHDPPTYKIAENLYSATFIKKLYKVLRKGGYVYFYTGYPGEVSSSKNIIGRIKKRCKDAGFILKSVINYGLLLFKPPY